MKSKAKLQAEIPEAVRKEKTSEEKEFYMSLPLTVSGLDQRGREFSEKSVLLSISSQEASFMLNTLVQPESMLRLVMPLPPKLSDGKKLYLVLKGTVKAVNPLSGNRAPHKINLKLDSRYFIGEEV
ncbi:MAG: PilZ domain-containing protein [Candidatus Saccharicenans sp.]